MAGPFVETGNPYRPDELGEIIVACRRRSEKDRMIAMGVRPTFLVYLYPFCVSFFLVVFLLVALQSARLDFLQHIPQPARLRYLGGAYATTCAFIMWVMVRRPKRPQLILRESGLVWKRRPIRFEDVSWIRFGREARGFERFIQSGNRAIGAVSFKNRVAAKATDRVNDASLTLYMTGGPLIDLKGVGIHTEPEDYRLFLDRLEMMRPRIFDPPPWPDGQGDLSNPRTMMEGS